MSFLLAFACALFFWQLGERDLWSSHEARAAMDAQSLLDADSPGWPRLFDGRLEVQKPPLYYWTVALIARLRGGDVDAFAVRFPAALAALLTVILVGLLATAISGHPLAGLLAGLVLATGIHFPWLARIGRIDMPLTLTTTLTVAAFVLALSRPLYPLLIVGYLSCAAGVLLKGPIGAVLPAAAVAGWLLVEGRWPAFWEARAWRGLLAETGAWWGIPLVLAVTVPVFVWAEQVSDGRFAHEFFWLHNVQRGLGGSRLRGHPWWLYGPYLLLYLLPYSPILLIAVFRGGWRDDRLGRLGLAWLTAVVVVLSAARFKRADYLLPAYPGAALFLGCVLARAWRSWAARAGVVGLAAVMLLGWAVRLSVGLPREEPYRDYRSFAAQVRRHAPAPAEVGFFRTEAHALAFHVGRPLAILVEWPRLQAWLSRPGTHYLIMPTDVADESRRSLASIHLEEVCRNTAGEPPGSSRRSGEPPGSSRRSGEPPGLPRRSSEADRHERPLVLLRARAAP